VKAGDKSELWREPGLRIAMLHRLGKPSLFGRFRGLSFSPPAFDAFLKKADDLKVENIDRLGSLNGERGLAITFDDGFASLVTEALPVLARRHRSATAFVLAGMLGQWNSWDAANGVARYRLMDKEQIREWLASGQHIGSHGITHRSLLRIPLAEAKMEIGDSRKRLSDLFGISVDDFCYPYGDFSPAIEAMVQEAGYQRACTTVEGANTASSNRFALKRIAVQHRRPWLAAILPGSLSAKV
jgi:peptidoglycan/xylan/chitin deacetylase (PgdA/CDA1 family)